MKKYKYLLMFLLMSIALNAQKIDKTSIIAENLIKLYIDNYIVNNRTIGVHVFNYSTKLTTSTIGIAIEALPEDYQLFKKTSQYRWFKHKNAEIIVFCGLPEDKKCNDFLNKINLDVLNSSKELLDKEVHSDILDYKVKAWLIGINKNGLIDSVNGTFIESEVANPKKIKKFLKEFSSLKLYQFYEGGELINIKK